MSNPKVDKVFAKLVAVPDGPNASNSEVLAALGLLASGILRLGFSDPTAEAARFCGALRAYVEAQRRRPLHYTPLHAGRRKLPRVKSLRAYPNSIAPSI